MKYAEQGRLGGWRTVPDELQNEATHVVLTVQEYRTMKSQISELQQRYDMAQSGRISMQQEAKNELAEALKKAEEERKKLAGDWRVYADELIRQIAYEKDMNKALRRVAKERANADRKLKPKKGHPGYVVLASKEKPYKYRDGQKMVTVILWETVLEMPFTVDLTPEQVQHEMQVFFQEDATGNWPINEIGITANYEKPYEQLIKDPEWKDWKEYNVLCDSALRANYKSGYWELIFHHTKPLGIVPRELRP